MSNSSIWPIDGTLSGTTTPVQSGPGRNGSEGVLHVSQSSLIRSSPSDCLIPYPEHSLDESYLSLEMQSMYSTDPANWDGV